MVNLYTACLLFTTVTKRTKLLEIVSSTTGINHTPTEGLYYFPVIERYAFLKTEPTVSDTVSCGAVAHHNIVIILGQPKLNPQT